MKGDSSTAPTRPPPGPVTPGAGVLGPDFSSQQAVASEFSASSKRISSRPLRLNAGDAVILGTHVSGKRSMSANAEAPLGSLVQGKSWPSSQRSGVMNDSLGVFVLWRRSVARPVSLGRAPGGIAPLGGP